MRRRIRDGAAGGRPAAPPERPDDEKLWHIVAAAATAAVLSGCIESVTTVSVEPDGAGTVTETVHVNRAAERMLAVLANLGTGLESAAVVTAAAPPPPPPQRAYYEARAAAMGDGVSLLELKTARRQGGRRDRADRGLQLRGRARAEGSRRSAVPRIVFGLWHALADRGADDQQRRDVRILARSASAPDGSCAVGGRRAGSERAAAAGAGTNRGERGRSGVVAPCAQRVQRADARADHLAHTENGCLLHGDQSRQA